MKKYTSKRYDLLAERLSETFDALYQGKTIDRVWLCETFGATERTAYRDLTRLLHLLDEVSTGCYKLSHYLLPAMHTGHLVEFAHFAGVAHLFPYSEGLSQRKHLKQQENMVFCVTSSLDNHPRSGLRTMIDSAISTYRMMTYDYRGKSRLVLPYRLINHCGLWYLAAVEDGRLKAFEMGRIERPATTERCFSPDSALTQELNKTRGIRFDKGIDATLWGSAHAAAYVIRFPLFPALRIVQNHPDGSLTLITQVNDKQMLFSLTSLVVVRNTYCATGSAERGRQRGFLRAGGEIY